MSTLNHGERAMQSIVLERAEFLALLDVVRATAIVGIDKADLFSASANEHGRKIEEGHRLLADRGLLRFGSDGLRVLDMGLISIATVLAYPDLALISVRATPGVGRQLFLHYVREGAVVEQTFPQEGQHRLATLANPHSLLDRLLEVLPVDDKDSAEASAQLPQSEFLSAKEYAEQGRTADAVAIFTQHGLTIETSLTLVNAIAAPSFSGTIALLRCEGTQIVDARNPAVVQGRESAWMIVQTVAGESSFTITRINRRSFRDQLAAYFGELIVVQLPSA